MILFCVLFLAAVLSAFFFWRRGNKLAAAAFGIPAFLLVCSTVYVLDHDAPRNRIEIRLPLDLSDTQKEHDISVQLPKKDYQLTLRLEQDTKAVPSGARVHYLFEIPDQNLKIENEVTPDFSNGIQEIRMEDFTTSRGGSKGRLRAKVTQPGQGKIFLCLRTRSWLE